MIQFEEPIYDIHCHIIPEVDDGAGSMEEALALLEEEVRQGVGGIILTPHYRKRMFETPESKIYSHYKMLLLEASERFPELELKLGCEFHAHMDMEEELQHRKYISMAGSDYILLEFSGRHTKSFIKERVSAALMQGFTPILAHVERYPAITENIHLVEQLKSIGVRIQVNADSILGLDGFRIKSFCKKLLKNNLVDFIGSDAHNMQGRETHIGECADYVAKKFGADTARKIFVTNPRMILENAP